MRVFVTVHAAVSLDGRIARERESTSLSTPEGRRSAHRARAKADAVLVGSDTVRIDDPRLTVREIPGRNPMRVVLASRLGVSPRARLFDKPGRTLVIGVSGDGKALTDAGAEVALVPPGPDGMVGLRGALEVLHARGVERLLVEGGSRVMTAFFRARLVHRVELEIAMTMLGAGTPLLGEIGEAPRLSNVDVERLGTSVLVTGDVLEDHA
ncbi:MAG: dihydrofolate reductase family protein [Labilithrix sp.]